MPPLPISASLQDYLESILNLSRSGEPVRVTDIAVRLNLAKASVTQALGVLQDQGLVDHQRYGPVTLTEQGHQVALTVQRRHEVILNFLIEVLKVDPKNAERDACLMEHAVSTETMEKLVRFLELYKQ
ncbi:MAG: metal-dependent transcriptional regulator [Dethiobacter sp.]|jgi:DtxR family Mn-dependent transcriptional regulator|nr:metal-dependent transcriptional regulator [Dethiobacter sp.]